MVRGQAGTNPGMPMSSPGHGVGPAHVWIEITACATKCSLVSEQAGRLSRLLAVSSWKPAGQSFHTRASIGSSMPSWRVRRTTPGDATCLEPSRNAAGAVAGAGPASFMAQRRPLVERPQEADDRQTPRGWMTVPYLRTGGSPCTSDTLVSSSPADCQARPQIRSPAPSPRSSLPSRRSCGGRSPSTTGPSSHAIIGSMTWAYRPSSAILVPLGRRAVSRTPTAACGALCRAR